MRLFPLLFALPLLASAAEDADWVKANYTKFEYRIPMRDGKKLFTAVYAPKDQSEKYPILLNRTPYSVSPYGADAYKDSIGPSMAAAKDKFIIVYQDVRGRYMSEGEFMDMRPQNPSKKQGEIDESSDTYDTIDWLVKHVPNNNGRVGMWGISYPGFYAAAGIIDAHPALKASSPQAPITDWFVGDDFHRNGAFYMTHAFGFYSSFGIPRPEPTTKHAQPFDFGTPDGYEFYLRNMPLSNLNERFLKNQSVFWNEMMRHGSYDEFWQARNLRPHLKSVKPAVMTVGGWFDAEDLFGALQTYRNIEWQSPGAYNTIVMGPWFHGGWSRAEGSKLGHVRFNSNTSEYYRDKIELPFFQKFLKDKKADLPEAYMFETGTNVWRTFNTWPPEVRHRQLYLHAGGKLSFTAPTDEGEVFDEYISDPLKPVPVIADISTRMTREHMVDDQRFASTRTDVLTYSTEPLEEDVTIAGQILPVLHVSTSGTDSDFVVKVIDVYPDEYPAPEKKDPDQYPMGNYQMLLRGEVFRGKFRNSFSRPEAFVPGKRTTIEYVMNDVLHTFRRGHRIMVQIQSSWFPLVDVNPQKFMDIYNAKLTDFQKATQRVYRSKSAPTHVVLGVLQSPAN